MYDFPEKETYTLDDLRKLVRILRAEDGCPWDREQTHASIRRDFLEETYEAVEAIDRDDPVLLREELGDVLFQVLFHAQIEEENGRFTLDQVITDVTRKMVIRHPHVFSGLSVSGSGQVLDNWETIKNTVKGTQSSTETLQLVPETFPALMRADKLLKRADKAGAQATEAEAGQLRSAFEKWDAMSGQESDASEALGALLAAVVGSARKKGVDAEMALLEACKGLIGRFAEAERVSDETGEPIADVYAVHNRGETHNHFVDPLGENPGL
jgi:tetrapyrrole methylase family protein/MazG family protein